MTLPELRQKVDDRLRAREVGRQHHRQEKEGLREARSRLDAAKGALVLAQGVAQVLQQVGHQQVADIVSRSLKAVFDEPYQFKILFEQKRGRTEASLVFEREGMAIDPISASGGGVVAVAAFALRLSCLLLSRPPLRRLLVLDEPFSFLSEEYQPRVRELLFTLAKELDCQFLIVTHLAAMQVGKVVQL